tara:strand:- start:406 stop:882 length:477 start_codon:yes stop_codon:yes gene_type:complete
MNKLFLFLFCSFLISSIEIFWDLGLGISKFSTPNHNQAIELSTFHRLEGLKKYYDNDYKTAIYHFSQLDSQDANHILYEHLDCYYLLDQLSDASELLKNYNNQTLSDNIVYLKSKINFKLQNYKQALDDLYYLKEHYNDSDYCDIIRFDIEKINLLLK